MTMQTMTPGNGDNLTINRRDAMAVTDDGPFANLMDAGKFAQLWRVAQMFAGSAMVPSHFQNKPNDCFIAAQMAIRLGVDPFMFLQNTYIVSGKPGMEGKLAIALVNTSGLFRDGLNFDLSGDGDDRGCIAWAVSRATGNRVEGTRVTIATAKAEGWYAKNPKWKNMPDLMLQYRAGAWFGRLKCPERLMGMQTVEELQDIAPEVTVNEIPKRGAKAVLSKLTSRPVSEGQTLEPADEPVIRTKSEQAEIVDQATGEVIDASTGQQRESIPGSAAEAEQDHTQPEPPDKDGPPAPYVPGKCPLSCTLDQMREHAAKMLGVDVAAAEPILAKWLATHTPKAFAKLTTAEKDKVWAEISLGALEEKA